MPKRRVKRHSVTQPVDKPFRYIPLTQGQNAIVDASDFDWLNQWNWCAYWDPDTESFYAFRGVPGIRMHRLILACASEEYGDHKNHDTLDNRRENLRKCTNAQNHANQRINATPKTSRFKGVTWNKAHSRWHARIGDPADHLGYFASEEDAAHAYDIKAVELYGEFAHLNFTPIQIF